MFHKDMIPPVLLLRNCKENVNKIMYNGLIQPVILQHHSEIYSLYTFTILIFFFIAILTVCPVPLLCLFVFQ